MSEGSLAPVVLAPIMLADDHPLFRAALARAVGEAAPGRALIETETLAGALAGLSAEPVGLLCLDLHMPDSDGLAGLLTVRAEHPHVPVVVVSGDTGRSVAARAIGLGAAGFVPKASDMATIREAIECVLDGETWLPPGADEENEDEGDVALKSLTPTQLKVLLHVRDGLLNKQIAYEMDISEATVKAHMTAVMQKLSVQTRTQAALMARRLEVEPSERSGG